MDSNDLNMLFTTLNAARIMMKNRDRQPHEEAIYTAIQHCQDEVFPRLKADLERARKALEQIAGWKNDTLGPRPKEFGPFDCDPSISSAFDRGVRMAFYRCADHAIAALAEIAH